MGTMGLIGTLLFLFGTLISFVVFLVLLILKNKNWKKALLCVGLSLVLGLVLIILDPGTSNEYEPKEETTTTQETTSKDEVVEEDKTEEPVVDTVVKIEEPVEEEKVYKCEYQKTSLEYIGAERITNMGGDDCVGLFFDFTNNDKESKAYQFIYEVQVFQDGVEIDYSIFHVNDESKNADNEIQTGKTIRVCEGFELRDTTSKLQVVVKPLVSFTDKNLMEFEIEIPE